jgi:hypothetical protein
VLFQTMHDIIGNAVAFFFRQLLAKSSHIRVPPPRVMRHLIRSLYFA